MSLLASIQSMLPRPERRSESQIEDDLDDEFAFHLEMKTRELMNEGETRESAREAAVRLFGDVDRIKRTCKRIALEERIMLQRVNFMMMVIVLLMVVGVGLQVFITQRYNTLALQAITSDLARMKFDAKAAEKNGVVYIDGDIARPGVYQIPQAGQLTVKRIVAAAGDVTGHADARATVSEVTTDGNSIVKFVAEHVHESDQKDYVLSADDHVHIELLTDPSSASAPKGESVLVQGDVVHPGWYPIETHEGATYLSDVLVKAGLMVSDSQIEITKDGSREDIRPENLQNAGSRYVLLPGQHLRVKSATTLQREAAAAPRYNPDPAAGTWRQVDDNGTPVPQGATMEVIDQRDIRNLTRAQAATLTMSDGSQFDLKFANQVQSDGPSPLEIRSHSDSRVLGGGGWTRKADGNRILIVINITPIVRDSAPLTFEHVDALPQPGGSSNRRGDHLGSNDDAAVEALTNFLKQILTRADQNTTDARGVLEHANAGIEAEFVDQPQVQAQLRELISESLRKLPAQ